MTRDRIDLRGLTVFGRHGVFDHERENGQDFVVDLSVRLDLTSAALSDDVTDTVHYGELAEAVAALVGGEPVALLETLAERIADLVLADARVESVEVTVHKPSAPITIAFGDVSVTIERRSDHRAVIALGSNLGDRGALLDSAVAAIEALSGVSVDAVSPMVESAALTPDGIDDDKPSYLNQVLLVRTALSPVRLLATLQRIEADHGRERGERWGDRTLDLDIVTYDDLRVELPQLSLPHPRAAERSFVLVPWLLIDSDASLPGVGRVDALLPALHDSVTVVSSR